MSLLVPALVTLMSTFVYVAADPSETVPVVSAQPADGAVEVLAELRSAGSQEGGGGDKASRSKQSIHAVAACEVRGDGGITLGAGDCAEARELCLDTPDPDDRMYWLMREPDDVAAPTRDDWVWVGQQCIGPGDAATRAIPALSVEAFRRLPLPPGDVNVQPPNRRTLVNVPTNVYAGAEPVLLPTTLLGYPVRVRATPVCFRWTYGDGARLETADPGAAYPALRTAHTYRAPGTRSVRLTTVYRGEYSVDGGPWLQVAGEAEVASPPVSLTVLAARTELVAGQGP